MCFCIVLLQLLRCLPLRALCVVLIRVHELPVGAVGFLLTQREAVALGVRPYSLQQVQFGRELALQLKD